MEKKVFRSRISFVLAGVVLTVFILITVPLFRYGGYVAVIIITGLWLLWFLNMIAGFRYEIANDKLCLKLWTMTFLSVNITDIASVERRNIRPYSPVASLKIWYNVASVTKSRRRFKKNQTYSLVYPVRKQEFLETLKSINSDIQITEKQGKWHVFRFWDWNI